MKPFVLVTVYTNWLIAFSIIYMEIRIECFSRIYFNYKVPVRLDKQIDFILQNESKIWTSKKIIVDMKRTTFAK